MSSGQTAPRCMVLHCTNSNIVTTFLPRFEIRQDNNNCTLLQSTVHCESCQLFIVQMGIGRGQKFDTLSVVQYHTDHERQSQ